jgi:hypothetical protein
LSCIEQNAKIVLVNSKDFWSDGNKPPSGIEKNADEGFTVVEFASEGKPYRLRQRGGM